MKPSKKYLVTLAIACAGLLWRGESLFAQGWCVQPVPPCDPANPGTACYKPPPPDPRCEPRECKKCTKSPCFVGSGAYTTDATDLHLPTPGFPLLAARRYENTQVIDSPTGYGWTSSFAARLYYSTYLLAAPDVVKREANVTMPTGDRYRFVENADGTFTPPLGLYDTLRRNADGTFDLTLQHSSSVLHFDSDGSLRRMADDYGNELIYNYDGSGRLERVADTAGSGRYIDVYWGANGRISSLVDSAGRQVGYSYDTRGVLTGVSDPLGRLTTYSYATGKYVPLLVAVRDHWNRVVSETTYDAQDRVTSYSENGETYTYAFNYQGNPAKTSKRDSAGNIWVFTHGSGGLVTADVPPSGGGTKATSYYADGSIKQVTDEVGVKTFYTYDTAGRPTSVILDYQGLSAVRHDFTYHPDLPNHVIEIAPRNPATGQRNPDWQGWKFDYHLAGAQAPGALHHVYRLRRDGATVDLMRTFEYDAQGRLTSEIDALGGRTDYQYDARGNLISELVPPNNDDEVRPMTVYSHDHLGRVVQVTDPVGRVITYEYDQLGRVVSETLPSPALGSTLDFTTTTTYDQYDPASHLLFSDTTDANGHVAREGRDQFGRTVVTVDPLGGLTRYSYAAGALSSITDANGNVTSFAYDALRRLLSRRFPNGNSEAYSYWPDGSLKTKTDRKGQTITYVYDAFKRLATKSQSSGGRITFSYAGAMLTAVEDTTVAPADSHTFGYDSSYRVTSVRQADRGTVTYTYTARDQVASYYVLNGSTTTYSYWPDGSVDEISWTRIPGAFKYLYNLAGQYQEISFPNGLQRLFTYDDQGRLLQVVNTHATTGPLATYTYGYDIDPATEEPTMLGLRTSITTSLPAQQLVERVGRYSYDANGQLVKVEHPADGTAYQWSYDAIGNRITSTTNGVTTAYTYITNGQSSTNGQRLATAGDISFSYDFNGSVISRIGQGASYSFGWNSDNKLTQVTGSATLRFQYDFQGRMSLRSDGGGTAAYVFNGLHPVAESGPADREYLFGAGIDEPIAIYHDGAAYFLAADGIGSIGVVSDQSGLPTASYVYGAWGEIIAGFDPEEEPNPFGYTGREAEADAGLHYFRARFLDPQIGRFLSEDPIQEVVPLVGAQVYAYVRNSPTAFTDPFGLQECSVDWQYGKAYRQEGWSEGWQLQRVMRYPALISVVPNSPMPSGIWAALFRAPRRTFFTLGTREECLWFKYFTATEYLIQKWTLIESCTCPSSRRVLGSGKDKKILGQHRRRVGSDVTFGFIGPGHYSPCKPPS